MKKNISAVCLGAAGVLALLFSLTSPFAAFSPLADHTAETGGGPSSAAQGTASEAEPDEPGSLPSSSPDVDLPGGSTSTQTGRPDSASETEPDEPGSLSSTSHDVDLPGGSNSTQTGGPELASETEPDEPGSLPSGLSGDPSQAVPVVGPYTIHGPLSVSGNSLIDSEGDPFLLRGLSVPDYILHPEYLDEGLLADLQKLWGINTVVLPLSEAEYENYLKKDKAAIITLRRLIAKAAELARRLDLYLVLSWQTRDTSFIVPTEKRLAAAFFQDIATLSEMEDHVLFDIGGSGAAGWKELTAYALPVIDTIRSTRKNSVILVGLPGKPEITDLSSSFWLDRNNLLYVLPVRSIESSRYLLSRFGNAYALGMPLLLDPLAPLDENGKFSATVVEEWLTLAERSDIGYVIGPLFATKEEPGLLSSVSDPLSEESVTDMALWFQLHENSGGALTDSGQNNGPSTSVFYGDKEGIWLRVDRTETTYRSLPAAEYTFTLSNRTSTALWNWKLRIQWTSAVSHYDYWNCDLGGTGNSRLVIPKDFNMAVPPDGTASFGLIVTSGSLPEIESILFE